MQRIQPDLALKLLQKMLVPIFRFGLRHSIGFRDFVDMAKRAAITVAEEEIYRTGAKLNTSRICAMTGLYRHEIARLREKDTEDSFVPTKVIWQIVNHWEQSEHFLTRAGKPRVLTFKGSESEFSDLVSQVSSDMSPASALFELERVGAVVKTPRGLKLKKNVREVESNPEEAYQIVADDIDSLLHVVEENVFSEQRPALPHFRTTFDNVYESEIPRVRKWLNTETKRFHDKLRKFLAGVDKDFSKKSASEKAAAQKVSFTSIGYTTLPPQSEEEIA